LKGDIIIAAVPYSAEKNVAKTIRKVSNQKIVVSISNPINKTFDGLATQLGSAAEELQTLLPNAKVIKAFNTTFADDFNQPLSTVSKWIALLPATTKMRSSLLTNWYAQQASILSSQVTYQQAELWNTCSFLLIQLTRQNKYNWIFRVEDPAPLKQTLINDPPNTKQ
jgi:hypothetical protein